MTQDEKDELFEHRLVEISNMIDRIEAKLENDRPAYDVLVGLMAEEALRQPNQVRSTAFVRVR